MKNPLFIPEIAFTFETEEHYYAARSTGYIETYNIARIKRTDYGTYTVDYPVHSREEFLAHIERYSKEEESELIEVYPSTHYYDIYDYD